MTRFARRGHRDRWPAARGGLRDGSNWAWCSTTCTRRWTWRKALALLNRQLGIERSRRMGATVAADFVVDVKQLRRQSSPPARPGTKLAPSARLLVDRCHDDRYGDLRNRPQHHQLRREGRGFSGSPVPRRPTGVGGAAPEDDGPGIADIERAASRTVYSTGRGLGLGLPGARAADGSVDRRLGPLVRARSVEMWKWIPPDG